MSGYANLEPFISNKNSSDILCLVKGAVCEVLLRLDRSSITRVCRVYRLCFRLMCGRGREGKTPYGERI
jgi:hypothetical protein